VEQSIYTILLADDDPDQLRYLSTMITKLRPDWQIVAQATTSHGVAQALAEHNPWLSILDVNFADTTSLEIVRGLRESFPVIYVTGDSRFAVDAFTCDPIDFLVKPISTNRFEQALRKAENLVNRQNSSRGLNRRFATSLRMIQGFELVWTPLTEVRYFQAQSKYTRVVLENKEGLMKMGLSSAAQHLSSERFWRISRSLILNIEQMSSAKRDELGRLSVKVNGRNDSLHVSKPYEHLFRDGFS
jgi:DNA-binding LytR/AlgR family response regulator